MASGYADVAHVALVAARATACSRFFPNMQVKIDIGEPNQVRDVHAEVIPTWAARAEASGFATLSTDSSFLAARAAWEESSRSSAPRYGRPRRRRSAG